MLRGLDEQATRDQSGAPSGRRTGQRGKRMR